MKAILSHSLFRIVLVSIIFIFSSCGGDDEVTTIEDFLVKFNLNANQTSSGLYYTLINQGSGVPITSDKFLLLSVRQFDLGNNIVSQSDEIFPVALSLQDLVPGLIEGLQLLNDGGRANFYIPPELSGGATSTTPLIFGIEIIGAFDSVTEYNDTIIEEYLDEQNLVATRTEEGLYLIINEPGEDPKPTAASSVTVDYHGYFLNGNVFDSSVDRGEPASFNLGMVIRGWQLGIPEFGLGGTGTIIVPSSLAYGSEGNASIPANYPIAFDITLISVP